MTAVSASATVVESGGYDQGASVGRITRAPRSRPVRIGVMLRHLRQHAGGVRIYTEHMLERLLATHTRHEFVFMYQDRGLLGTYAGRAGVEETALELPGGPLWDQLAVPWLARRHQVDVIFNPKFSVPFLSSRPKVFVLHGSEWFVIPQAFLWYDRLYARALVPLYCRRATRVITVADRVKQDAVEFTGVDASKFVRVHNGFDRERFAPVLDQDVRDRIRARYALPERYLLWVGQLYPPKNFGRIVRALDRIRDRFHHPLIIAGEPRWSASPDLAAIEELGLQDRVRFLGWVSQDDLPGLYSMADLFLFPSLHEGFGIPLVEAMASGCPIVTSRTGSPPEVVRDAGVLVDPLDVDSIAEGIARVLSDAELRHDLSRRGIERARAFSWERCAEEVLTILESCAAVTEEARG